MLNRRASLRLLFLGGTAVGLSACGGGGGTTTVAPSGGAVSGGTVLEVLRANGLTRFLKALQTTGLDQTLAGDGPYTVFAPTNRAFAAAKLPNDPDELRRTIANHIIPGMFTSDFLRGVNVNYTTLAGSPLPSTARAPRSSWAARRSSPSTSAPTMAWSAPSIVC